MPPYTFSLTMYR